MIKKFPTQEDTHTTEAIYKSCKMIVGMVGSDLSILQPEVRKHIEGYRMFIDGYEKRVITHWDQFFRTPADYAKYADRDYWRQAKNA